MLAKTSQDGAHQSGMVLFRNYEVKRARETFVRDDNLLHVTCDLTLQQSKAGTV